MYLKKLWTGHFKHLLQVRLGKHKTVGVIKYTLCYYNSVPNAGGLTPLIPNLCTWSKYLCGFTPRPLNSRGNLPRHPSKGGTVTPQFGLGGMADRKTCDLGLFTVPPEVTCHIWLLLKKTLKPYLYVRDSSFSGSCYTPGRWQSDAQRRVSRCH